MKDLKRVNTWFKESGSFIIRFRWIFLIALLLLDIIAVFGVKKIEIIASDQGLFLEDDEIVKATRTFEEYFGNNDFVALLVESDDVFSATTLRMIRELCSELELRVPYVDQVISLTNLRIPIGTENGFDIIPIIPEKIPTSLEELKKLKTKAFSKKILINKLFSDDSRQTWIIINLLPYPENWRNSSNKHPEFRLGEKVLEVIGSEKFKGFNIKATGYPVTQFEGNEFFKKETVRNILISMIVAIILLTLFLRSLRGVIFPIITTVSSLLIVYGAMGYAGVKINNLVITIPLLLGMSISIGYSVHIFNFFRYKSRSSGKRRGSILYAMEHTGWPMFFTALTTFGSFLSFVLIPISILQWLGFTTAMLVMVIYLIVITITPALLSFGNEITSTDKYLISKKYSSQSLSLKFGKLVLSNQRKIVTVVIILIIISVFGIIRTKVKVDHKTTFGTKLSYIKKAHYIAETKIGSLYNYNIILDFPNPESAKDPLILKNLEILVNEIKGLKLTKRVTSIIDMVKELNQVVHGEKQEFYSIPSDKQQISHLLLLYEMSDGNQIDKWVDYDYKLLRIMVEVKDYDTAFILQEKEYLKKRMGSLFPGVHVGFSGVLYRVAHVQNYIIKGELISFFVAMFVICFLMSIVFRSFKAGIIGIVPNLVSASILVGVMGFFGIPMNLITMTIIPMLLGIGVDDSIHFINHMKFEINEGRKYSESILRSFKTVGYTLFITSFVLIAVFSIYTTSIVKMFIHFGVLTMLGLGVALLSTYLLIPILIIRFKPFK